LLASLGVAVFIAAPAALLLGSGIASAASEWTGSSNTNCNVLPFDAGACLPYYVTSDSLGHEAVQYPETNNGTGYDQYGGDYWNGSQWILGSAGFVQIYNGNSGAVLLTNVASGVPEQVNDVWSTDTFLLSY
jgi:hypothetical protein